MPPKLSLRGRGEGGRGGAAEEAGVPRITPAARSRRSLRLRRAGRLRIGIRPRPRIATNPWLRAPLSSSSSSSPRSRCSCWCCRRRPAPTPAPRPPASSRCAASSPPAVAATSPPSAPTTAAGTSASSRPPTSRSAASASPPTPGSTSRRSSSGRRPNATMCRSTPAATSSGSTASPANDAPRKSGLGFDLTLYDPRESSSGSTVSCKQGFCAATYGGKLPGCGTDDPCEYKVTYGDGSSTTGFFVTDSLQFDQVTGDGQTQPGNGSVTFGCGAQQGGDLGSSNQALDGIVGFGQANTSMLSQLASAGKVKKVFAHCLDTIKGGGVFAIGNVVQPKVKTTPLVADMPHYNVNLKSIDVGGTTLQLPAHIFETGEKKGTIIDSGTTLTYLPELVFKEVMLAVFNKHQDITFHNVQDFLCFQYSGSVDDGFPTITFHFEDDLALHVYPHEYFFANGNDAYCVGFQNGGSQSKDGKDIVLMGDLVLSNKLVVYDLENQVIGWTDYNCSSSIKVKDDKTGATYTVNSHDIESSGWRFQWHKSLVLLLVTLVCSYLIC